jgi:hypothetical protein
VLRPFRGKPSKEIWENGEGIGDRDTAIDVHIDKDDYRVYRKYCRKGVGEFRCATFDESLACFAASFIEEEVTMRIIRNMLRASAMPDFAQCRVEFVRWQRSRRVGRCRVRIR